jgi:serine protease Do
MNIFRHIFLILAAALALTLPLAAAEGGSFALKRGMQWLTVAYSPDLDTAIGMARHYLDEQPRVVQTDAAVYAVVIGPYRARSIGQLQNRRGGFVPLARNAVLSRGENFVATAWKPQGEGEAPVRPLAPYSINKPLKLSTGALSVVVKMHGRGKDAGATEVIGTIGGKPAFDFKFADSDEFVQQGAAAGFARLDAATDEPQLVVTRYSGGAHCCTTTWIVTKPKGSAGYVLLQAETLDGEGYQFIESQGDGTLILTNPDNAFLYAFDSYAGSFAPLQYKRLVNAEFENISNRPETLSLRKQDLAYLEFHTTLDQTKWSANGFLVAWVATRIRLGFGEDAWTTAIENHDRNSEFGMQECEGGKELEICPDDMIKRVPFPKALATFLQETGYGPLPQAALSSVR